MTGDDLMGLTGDDGDIDDYMYDMDIARHVEQEKLDQIYQAANDLKGRLAQRQGRCNICTLKPPCRHIKEVAIIDEQIEPTSKMTDDNKSKMSTKKSLDMT